MAADAPTRFNGRVATIPPAEQHLTVELVRALLAEQCPDLAELPVEPYAGGWDNELFRLGDTLLVRLPRREAAARLAEHELRWVPTISRRLLVETPQHVFAGRPGCGFPWLWSIVPWIEGRRAAEVPRPERISVAGALADVFHALHVTAAPDAPENPWRGGTLNRPQADEAMRARVATLGDTVDTDAVLTRWESWRAAPDWDHADVWLHGDAHPYNIVIGARGDLTGVIDWGDLTSGDPACDLATAWLTFDQAGRDRFVARANLGGLYDADTWTRARAWALQFAVLFLTQNDDRPALRGVGADALVELLAEPVG